MSNNHLIVGLGGTGGKVIRELRKTIERNRDTKGNSPSEAHFEFAYLDTSEDVANESHEWDVLGKDVSLARAQRGTFPARGVLPILADPQSFPGMRDWIEPRNVFDFVDTGTAGASQRRKLGRLVFAQNATEIRKLLEDRLKELETASKSAQATIHVVCGLAGGTGSGFIVDTVAQLRALRPNDSDHRIMVYALLPDEGSSWGEAVAGHSTYYANGYAALAELNALGARSYHPINVADGRRMAASKYFNGCYLVNHINENKVRFGVKDEVPRIMAEFLYQKTLNQRWTALERAERGENDTNFIEMDDGQPARAKLFMTFGIKRVVVPEQEIREFMAYSFAEQATRQLMFNNFRQGEGYANEAVQKDWGSEARKPDVLQRLLLSDAHLTLDTGILEDDLKAGWKPVREYWQQIGSQLDAQIKADKTLKEADWIARLDNRMSEVYDDTFRRLGGVHKFYEVKDQARLEMARHIASTVEKDFFQRWSSGELSLMQLRQFSDALLANLAERKKEFEERVQRAGEAQERLKSEIAELARAFNDVGFLKRMVSDKRDTLFSEIRDKHQALYALRTLQKGHGFGARLLPLAMDLLTTLRGRIDHLHQQLERATASFGADKANRLREGDDPVYQQRIFDASAVKALMKDMTLNERDQLARTQQVRKAIIALGGSEVDGFDKLAQRVSDGALLNTLSQQAAAITEAAHTELAKNATPVLHVNIVERLARQYEGNAAAMRSFVTQLYREAGSMAIFDEAEVNRVVPGNDGAARGRQQTICVMLPECEENRAFQQTLQQSFRDEKDPGTSETAILNGALPNEIVVMKVSSLMPARFLDSLKFLKGHYDGLLRDAKEAVLLHSEGRGDALPPLFARTGAQVQTLRNRKPQLLLARLLAMVSERSNPETGLQEWILKQMVDGRMRIHVLAGGASWAQVLEAAQTPALQQAIDEAVTAAIAEQYRHIEKKNELHKLYNDMVNARLEAAQYNERDPEYMTLDAMGDTMKQLIGLPA
jgi:hypothetical protein